MANDNQDRWVRFRVRSADQNLREVTPLRMMASCCWAGGPLPHHIAAGSCLEASASAVRACRLSPRGRGLPKRVRSMGVIHPLVAVISTEDVRVISI
jgi:hypothetical protein